MDANEEFPLLTHSLEHMECSNSQGFDPLPQNCKVYSSLSRVQSATRLAQRDKSLLVRVKRSGRKYFLWAMFRGLLCLLWLSIQRNCVKFQSAAYKLWSHFSYQDVVMKHLRTPTSYISKKNKHRWFHLSSNFLRSKCPCFHPDIKADYLIFLHPKKNWKKVHILVSLITIMCGGKYHIWTLFHVSMEPQFGSSVMKLVMSSWLLWWQNNCCKT